MKSFLPNALWLAVILLTNQMTATGQEKINVGDIKLDLSMYIFYEEPTITKCDQDGNAIANDPYAKIAAPKYATFTIHKAIAGDKYVIEFLKWRTNGRLFESDKKARSLLGNALKYNYQTPAGLKDAFVAGKSKIGDVRSQIDGLKDAFFLITKDDLLNYAYVYKPIPKYEFSYGTISYLARLRPKTEGVPGAWSTDLSLGLAAGVKRNFGSNASLLLLAGLAVSKVTLDSASTLGLLASSKDHVALTPNLNLLFSYNVVSIGFGIGFDWINQDSQEAQKWIYNNKIFYSIAFGINIFKSSADNTTTKTQTQ